MRWCKWSQKKLKLYFLTLNEVFKYDWLVCITEKWLEDGEIKSLMKKISFAIPLKIILRKELFYNDNCFR